MLVSAIISGASSRPTQAESLLYKTTCGVVGLLGVQCQPAPAAQQTPTPASESGSGKSTTAETGPSNKAATPTAPSNQPASQPATTSFTAVNMPDQQLPTIVPVSDAKSTMPAMSRDFVSYSLPTIGGKSDAAVLGAAIQTPLQPSSQGWKIFGVAWYWWVLAIAAIVVLGRLVMERFQTHRRVAQHS
ncbi:MAG: hypothetical protein JWN12_718 [Candidatus Saccharibacteria bacterium]|nr:hypothetical protein [Candidatus Saccharibacteria bacterium]